MTKYLPKLCLFLSCAFFCLHAHGQDKQLAITIDDGPAVKSAELANFTKISRDLRQAFVAAKVPAIMFINEMQLDVPGERESRKQVLVDWLDAGLELGNHTYSHVRLRDTKLDAYFEDVLRGEKVTRPLLETRGEKLVWFRYPFLSSESGERARRVEEFLLDHEYRIAPVTVDYHDYSFATNYRRFLRAGDQKSADDVVAQMRKALDVAFERAEANASTLVGRKMPLILLIHCNELNADMLPETLKNHC